MAKVLRRSKVMIVDDHPLVREALAMRIGLQEDLLVCGEAATEDEALTLIEAESPDLVLVDLALRAGHGIELIKQVRARYPKIKMLVVSGFQESLYAERALRAGALGYLNKQESNSKVIDAIRTVLRGERYMGPDVSRRLIDLALGNANPQSRPIDQLTDRELEVFRLIGQGMTTGAIAEQLIVSTHTIDTHRENIKRKMNFKNAGELTRAAVQWVLENG